MFEAILASVEVLEYVELVESLPTTFSLENISDISQFQTLYCENDFYLREYQKNRFYIKGLVPALVLKQSVEAIPLLVFYRKSSSLIG